MENGVGAWAPHAAASVHSSKRAGTRAPFLRQGVLAPLAPRAAEIAALLEDRWRGFYEGYAHKRPSRAGGGRKASCAGAPPPKAIQQSNQRASKSDLFFGCTRAPRLPPWRGGARRWTIYSICGHAACSGAADDTPDLFLPLCNAGSCLARRPIGCCPATEQKVAELWKLSESDEGKRAKFVKVRRLDALVFCHGY